MYCNARKSGNGDLEQREPGEEHAGEGYCKKTAGAGTEHKGRGRCSYHGGLSQDDGRLKSGLYSEHTGDVLREKIKHAEGADVESMEEEIHLMRAALDRLSENFDSMPPEELERLVKIASKIGRSIERLNKIRYGEKNTITVQEVDRFVYVVMEAVEESFERCEDADEMIDVIGARLDKATEGALDGPPGTGGRR